MCTHWNAWFQGKMHIPHSIVELSNLKLFFIKKKLADVIVDRQVDLE